MQIIQRKKEAFMKIFHHREANYIYRELKL